MSSAFTWIMEETMAEPAKNRSKEDNRYVVSCARGRDYARLGYIFFTHEADVMAIAAAEEVQSGKLTPTEARELLKPYREFLSPLYIASQQWVVGPDRYGCAPTHKFL